MTDTQVIKNRLINVLTYGVDLPANIDLNGNMIINPATESMNSAAATIVRMIYEGQTPTAPEGNIKSIEKAA